MKCAVERGGSASSSATEQLLKIYISCIYLGSGIVKAPIFIDEKDVPEAGAVSCGKGGAGTPLGATLRKGQRGLPVFLDELNDALEAHDVEEYGRIASAMRALLARHEEGGSGALSLTQAR